MVHRETCTSWSDCEVCIHRQSAVKYESGVTFATHTGVMMLSFAAGVVITQGSSDHELILSSPLKHTHTCIDGCSKHMTGTWTLSYHTKYHNLSSKDISGHTR